MREYELYLVIDGDVPDENVSAVVERTTQQISTGAGGVAGEVIKVESRGKRRLAYPIRKKVEGQDVVMTFRTPPPALKEIERTLKLDEQVLRYLLVRMDED